MILYIAYIIIYPTTAAITDTHCWLWCPPVLVAMCMLCAVPTTRYDQRLVPRKCLAAMDQGLASNATTTIRFCFGSMECTRREDAARDQSLH